MIRSLFASAICTELIGLFGGYILILLNGLLALSVFAFCQALKTRICRNYYCTVVMCKVLGFGLNF